MRRADPVDLIAKRRPVTTAARAHSQADALCATLLTAAGITSKSARLDDRTAARPYSPGQMTDDLRRRRLAGLIRRIEHTNTDVLTPDGTRVAVFYTKLHNRLLRSLLAADQAQAPLALRQALPAIDQHVDDYITRPASAKPRENLTQNVQKLETKDR